MDGFKALGPTIINKMERFNKQGKHFQTLYTHTKQCITTIGQ